MRSIHVPHHRETFFTKNQIFGSNLSLFFCPFSLDVSLSLLLLLQTPNNIGIDKFLVDIACLTSKGTAKDANEALCNSLSTCYICQEEYAAC